MLGAFDSKTGGILPHLLNSQRPQQQQDAEDAETSSYNRLKTLVFDELPGFEHRHVCNCNLAVDSIPRLVVLQYNFVIHVIQPQTASQAQEFLQARIPQPTG